MNNKVVIIGGGLAGLTLGYFLQQRNIGCTILEAAVRPGGRIQTIYGNRGTPMELGATWFSDMHQSLNELIAQLGLEKFNQFAEGISLFQTKSFEPPQAFYVPESSAPSYRIAGGSAALIAALAQEIGEQHIHLGTKVHRITERPDGITVACNNHQEFHGHMAVLCLPPQLAAASINFAPALPESTMKVLPGVHTWMEGAVKFTIEYDHCFWREAGYSGMLYSHAGIITEMYDHTSQDGKHYAFTGFLNGAAAGYTPETRKTLVIAQLRQLYGEKAGLFSFYQDKVWLDEYIGKGSLTPLRPHQHNGHPVLHEGYMGGKLFFCGTETAGKYPGYMEGAVIAARMLAEKFFLLF
ncbi:NAD(P)/FAD-dependent oxidoreductase [Chitinophaga sp. Cy-1792]|uniref:flavin monoamine oxidase family protein n=1 Tax=Chitinophaga sp. Cy-1792 TaxID=2608339 RepID=UPI0014218723|nr:NAD(P)/FAD-dependent oxidoreductase [Chitinophaga sp. Cy-1792]NIG56691.1 FAD-dependent oxidoreductase [Chitinophaga sp. Cy-1792]